MKTIEETNKSTREEIQQRGIEFSKTNPFMLFQYPTGLGKSYTAIKSLEFILSNNSNFRCLLVEPEITLKKNIEDEFIKFNCKDLLKNTDIICYHSLKKINTNYDVIIFDEAHHIFSEKRLNYISNQTPKYMYLLSATIFPKQIKSLEDIFGKNFLCHKISLKNAIDWDILPAPKIGIFKLRLGTIEKDCTYIFKRGSSKKKRTIEVKKEQEKWSYLKNKILYPDLELIVHCTEQEKYNQLVYERDKRKELYTKAKRENNCTDYIEKNYLYSELCIKRFLSEIKTKYLEEFLKDASKSRLIAFVGFINQAEILKSKIPDLNIISSKEKIDSQIIIDKFNNKEINNIVAIGKLQEGANLKDIEIVVISQLDGGTRALIQKVGRGLRSRYPEIYLFIYEKTKDEEYLANALMNFKEDMTTELDYFYNVN